MTRIPYPLRDAWAITEDGAQRVLDVWETAHATGRAERIAAALEARDGEPFNNERNVSLVDGVAVITIDGPLMRKAELFTDISGATSYQWIGATVDKARTDAAVKKVLLRFNSPGGEAAGCGECGEKIARLAAEKPTEAYIETLCASAALWLATQCRSITAHPTAEIGWVGAVRTLVDSSEQDAKNGIKRKQLVSRGAEDKRTEPMTDAVVARAQERIDEIGALFTAAVAKGRDVSTKKVLADFGGGDGMIAARALSAGLVDRLSSFDSTLARLVGAERTLQPSPPGVRMATSTDPARASDSDNEWKCGKCSEMMGPSAKKFCAKCTDDDDGDEDDDKEDAKALATAGLLGKKKSETRGRILGFVQSMLRATGAASAEDALVAARRGAKAIADLDALAAKAVTDEQAKAKADALGAIKAAVEGGALALGEVSDVLDFVGADAEADKVRAVLAATTPDKDGQPVAAAQTLDAVLAAFGAATYTAKDARRICTHLGGKGSTLPGAHREPSPTDENRQTATTFTAEQARKFGIDPAKASRLLGITSVADLPRPTTKEA